VGHTGARWAWRGDLDLSPIPASALGLTLHVGRLPVRYWPLRWQPFVRPKAAPKTPPTFLPMENMVVNLADPGGDRFAQVGITLELADAKTGELVKSFMPSIRSNVLLLVSQRSTEELLTREGKEKLAVDIRREVSRPLGFTVPKPRKRPVQRDPEDEEEDDEVAPRRAKADNNPVRQVLFSSFIIQ
jgi:flagellar FliL protein